MIKKLKLLVLLFICSCSVTAMASEQSPAQKNKKLELKMSIPMPNGTFVHLSFNPFMRNISFNTYGSDHIFLMRRSPASLLPGLEINESLILKGLAQIEGGLLAVFIQPVNKQLNYACFLKCETKGLKTIGAPIAGKIKDIKIKETPDKSLLVKYLVKLSKERMVKASARINKSFDEISDACIVSSYTKQ